MRSAFALLIVVATAAACAEAGGESTGGQLTPAGQVAQAAPVFTPPPTDAGSTCGTGGSKWSELYRDIFATGQPGSCTYQSSCHGTPTGDGALSGAGIKCFDEAGCRASVISQHLATVDNKGNPGAANLFGVLRIRDATGKVEGIMPKAPADYVFPQACIDRLKGWIANGVPAD